MSDKRFDDFLKQSFSDYSPEVPSHIWDNIASGQKKKRPAFFWLNKQKALLALVVLLLAGGGIYWAVQHQNNTTPDIIAHENNGSRQETGNTVPAAVLQDKNENADKNTASDQTTAESTSPVESSAAGKDAIQQSTKTDLANDNDDRYSSATSNRKADIVNKNNVPAKRSKISTNRRVTHTITPASPASDEEVKDTNDDIEADETTADANGFNVPGVSGSRDLLLLATENMLNKQRIQVNPVKMKEDCPGNTSGNNYYFEAYISPDYAIKSYSDTGNSILVAKRKESLKVQSAFSAGLRYTRVFNNGISVRTGFNYSQVNEKFSYAADNVVQIIYVINNQGDTTDSYYVRGTRYKHSYNRYRTIDVPLVMGYEMGNGRLHANINAGVMVNIYSWQAGETLDNNGEPVSITTGKDDNPYQYKTNLGIGFTSAVSLYYKLNDRFHVLAEPYFRYNFSPMNKETLSIQEKFTTIGLRLGIRMDIK